VASETAQALYPYPAESPGTIRIAEHQIGDVAALLNDTGADVDDGSLLLSSSWRSDSAARAVSDVRVLAKLLPADGGRLGTAAAASSRYVSGLEDARDGIDAIRTRYDAAVATRDQANAHVPEVLKANRYEREEYRHGNQSDLDAQKKKLDVDYDTELATLATVRAGVLNDLQGVLDVLAPAQLRRTPGDYGTAAFVGIEAALSLVAPVDAPEDPVRRAGQAAAFARLFGHPPAGSNDWSTAAMLDATSYLTKNGGTDAVVQVGRITPRPGQGVVRIGLYIPSAEVFNFLAYDLGDNRGPDSQFDPEQTRVTLYVDYENGVVIARQNPSVNTDGEVGVRAPLVGVQELTDGSIRLQYDAENPFAPPDPSSSHTVNGDVSVRPPSVPGGEWHLDGTIGDYPAFEAYQDDPLGRTQALLQDAADNEGRLGPLLELPTHHDIGDGQGPLYRFRTRRALSGPYYEYLETAPFPLGDPSAPTPIPDMPEYNDPSTEPLGVPA
jgi:hypothetical protein